MSEGEIRILLVFYYLLKSFSVEVVKLTEHLLYLSVAFERHSNSLEEEFYFNTPSVCSLSAFKAFN